VDSLLLPAVPIQEETNMPTTPSLGLDQNEKQKFIDRYWGRVPKFLHRIPEQNICEANPDYIKLLNQEHGQ